MRFTVAELADHLGATVTGCEPSALVVDGLSIDSRNTSAGQLFAALRDERDGHDFVAAARRAGAPAVLVERPVDDGAALVVSDVPAALAALARLARGRLSGPVIGVTGSVGKTTTKDMLSAVLATTFVTAASERSFNNELGVPLTLLNAPVGTEATVVEMGARGAGHIALLCSMACPTVGVVTTVHSMHTEVMGDEDAIARAKGELVEALPRQGLAVLNRDDHRVAAMGGLTDAAVLTFGLSPEGDLCATGLDVGDDLRVRFELRTPWGSTGVHLGARGSHNVLNALAAAGTALWSGVSLEDVAAGLAEVPASPWRMELVRCRSGLLVLNDSYNAGPASMAAALRALVRLDAPRRMAVLGTMAELGELATLEGRKVAELAEQLGVDVVAVGTDLYRTAPVGAHEAVEAVLGVGGAGEGTAVLVKGSRVAGLEEVARSLVERGGGPVVG